MKHYLTTLFILVTISLNAQSIEKLSQSFNNRDYKQVVDSGKQSLNTDPDNPRLNSLVGRSLTKMGQFNNAIPYLEKGIIENDNPLWVQAWSYNDLGVCYYATDDFLKSKACFKKSIQLSATQNSTKAAMANLKVFQMTEIYADWEIINTEHFRFHFQNKDGIKNIEKYILAHEEAYTEINKFFNAEPYKKIDFFVWDNRAEGEQILGRILGFANPKFCVINARKDQTRGHEMTHILLVYGVKPKVQTPFINEGAASYFDQTNRNRLKTAKQVLDNEQIDLLDLWDNPNKFDHELNYPVGAAWIEYLHQHGSDEQLKKLFANQTSEAAREIYTNFDQMVADFEKRLNK